MHGLMKVKRICLLDQKLLRRSNQRECSNHTSGNDPAPLGICFPTFWDMTVVSRSRVKISQRNPLGYVTRQVPSGTRLKSSGIYVTHKPSSIVNMEMRVVSSIRTWTADNHGNPGATHACNSTHHFHLLVYLPPCYLSIALHTVQFSVDSADDFQHG